MNECDRFSLRLRKKYMFFETGHIISCNIKISILIYTCLKKMSLNIVNKVEIIMITMIRKCFKY